MDHVQLFVSCFGDNKNVRGRPVWVAISEHVIAVRAKHEPSISLGLDIYYH